jgi:hypothetical protein
VFLISYAVQTVDVLLIQVAPAYASSIWQSFRGQGLEQF